MFQNFSGVSQRGHWALGGADVGCQQVSNCRGCHACMFPDYAPFIQGGRFEGQRITQQVYICWVRGDAWPSVCHFWVRNTYGPSMHWPESRRLRECTVDRCCHDFLAVSGASRVNRAGRWLWSCRSNGSHERLLERMQSNFYFKWRSGWFHASIVPHFDAPINLRISANVYLSVYADLLRSKFMNIYIFLQNTFECTNLCIMRFYVCMYSFLYMWREKGNSGEANVPSVGKYG